MIQNSVYKPQFGSVRRGHATTLFHELLHSTGHSSRLDRSGPGPKAVRNARLLVAELGAAFLATAAGIGEQTVDQCVAYIHRWLRKLSADKKLALSAAGLAQRAADWIMGEG